MKTKKCFSIYFFLNKECEDKRIVSCCIPIKPPKQTSLYNSQYHPKLVLLSLEWDVVNNATQFIMSILIQSLSCFFWDVIWLMETQGMRILLQTKVSIAIVSPWPYSNTNWQLFGCPLAYSLSTNLIFHIYQIHLI